MNAVGAAYAGRRFESQCLPAQNGHELLYVVGQNGIGLFEQIAVGRIDDVGARQTVVHPLALLAQRLADGACECHYIVTCLLFDLLYAGNVERRILP